MSKATVSITYEKWALLSERDITFLKALGAILLPESAPREPKEKVVPLPEYYVTINFFCKLCKSEHIKHYHMQEQKGGYLKSLEIAELPAGEISKTRSERVPTCPHCRKELMCYEPEELISKLMKLSNLVG